MELRGSVAIVTGANRGLGKCFVDALITRGAAKVYTGARDPDNLTPLLETHGNKVVALRLDVTSDADAAAAAEQASDATLLINNAGALESLGLMEAGSLEPLRLETEVNVYGPARLTLAFAPVLAANGGGAVMNVLSVASLVAFPAFGTYSATKAALMSLTHSLRTSSRPRTPWSTASMPGSSIPTWSTMWRARKHHPKTSLRRRWMVSRQVSPTSMLMTGPERSAKRCEVTRKG